MSQIFYVISQSNKWVDMRQSSLPKLIGEIVVDADLTPADAGLLFDEEITLKIYNRYSATAQTDNRGPMLIGARITNVEETSDWVVLSFDSGTTIIVDLTEDAFTSPEAMQLRIPGLPIVIWN